VIRSTKAKLFPIVRPLNAARVHGSLTLAARLAGKTAAETISVMLAIFARIKPALRKSITFDNDTAFAQHGLLQSMCAMAIWFCDAYASWQKGGVENGNGRLRRWLPRHIDIDLLSDEETANLTPRKCLGFKNALPGDPQRAWQRRPNPLLLNLLRFAPESTQPDDKMLFLGLGTGLGSTMIVDGVVEPSAKKDEVWTQFYPLLGQDVEGLVRHDDTSSKACA
jgi:hypothetical protein